MKTKIARFRCPRRGCGFESSDPEKFNFHRSGRPEGQVYCCKACNSKHNLTTATNAGFKTYAAYLKQMPAVVAVGGLKNYRKQMPAIVAAGGRTNYAKQTPAVVAVGGHTNYLKQTPAVVAAGGLTNYAKQTPAIVAAGGRTNYAKQTPAVVAAGGLMNYAKQKPAVVAAGGLTGYLKQAKCYPKACAAKQHRRALRVNGLANSSPADRDQLLQDERGRQQIRKEFQLKVVVEHRCNVRLSVELGIVHHSVANTRTTTERDNQAKLGHGDHPDYPVTPLTYQELIDNPGFLRYLLLLQSRNLPTFTKDAAGAFHRTWFARQQLDIPDD